MTRSLFLITAAALAITGCKQQPTATNAAGPVKAEAVVAPNGDWTKVVSKTNDGGYRMGNPDAKVALIEYAAFTCSHCREFEETGMTPLIDNYVKKGLVSLEIRPFALSPLDMPAAMLARCGGEATVFGMTRALFAHQPAWLAKVGTVPAEQLQALDAMPAAQRIGALADLTGLKDWAALNGLPRAKADQCLADQNAATELVKIQSDGIAKYQIPGTPAFVLNGTLVDTKPGTPVWTQLEAALKGALS